jgi:hypothetical protein
VLWAQPGIEEICALVRQHRAELRSGQLRLEYVAESDFVYQYEIDYQDEQCLIKLLEPAGSFNDPDDAVPATYSRTQTYLATGEFLAEFQTENRVPSGRYVAHVRPREERISIDPEVRPFPGFDPRVIGLVPHHIGLWYLVDWSEFWTVDANSQVAAQVSQPDPAEPGHWQVTFYNGSAEVTALVDSLRGYSPLRVVADYGDYQEVMNIELGEFDSGTVKFWFPRQLESYRSVGDQVFMKMQMRTISAEFNQLQDADVFTLSGSGLPEGTLVNGHLVSAAAHTEKSPMRIFKRGELHSLAAQDVSDRRLSREFDQLLPNTRVNGWQLFLLNLFVVSGAIALWSYRRWRSRSNLLQSGQE